MAGMVAAELEKKVKSVLMEAEEEVDVTHTTFGQRAEAYYRKRPQLLYLLNHLYTSYVSQSHRRLPSDDLVSDVGSSSCLTDDEGGREKVNVVVDRMVEEVVIGSVEKNIVALLMKEEEGGGVGRSSRELRRKVELQRSLVEVLESERMVLLKENARLGYENRALEWEAAELGRCLMRLRRDDHRRSSILARKIGDLQGQIHALERRNQDYSDQLLLPRRLGGGIRATVARWWDHIWRFEFLLCGARLETAQGQGQGHGHGHGHGHGQGRAYPGNSSVE